MTKAVVAWGIEFRGDLIESTIRMLRKMAIEDYVNDVNIDWKQCMHDGCRAVKVRIEKV